LRKEDFKKLSSLVNILEIVRAMNPEGHQIFVMLVDRIKKGFPEEGSVELINKLNLLLNAPNGKTEAFQAPISTIYSSAQTVSTMTTEATSAAFISVISGRNFADLEAIRKELGRMVHTKLIEEVAVATAVGDVSPSLQG